MKIFLSYRRADNQITAGRMAQFLDAIPAVDEVFLDVDDIAVGVDFEQKIERTLAQASHAFVLIGPAWRGPDATSGRPRIFEADDVVRLETGLALRSAVRLVPILVDDTRMPRADELPEDLKLLSKRNAFNLRTAHFDEDMDVLLDALIGGRKGRGSRWARAPLTPAGIALRALAGLAASGVLLLGAAIVNRYASTDCYDLACTVQATFGIADETDALGLLWVLAIGMLALGTLAPFVPRMLSRRR